MGENHQVFVGLRILLSLLTLFGLQLAVTGCRSGFATGGQSTPSDAKSDIFGYRRWVTEGVKPDVVLIGIHGFCGASMDYDNLGSYFLKHQPQTAVYAYELRGQGSDPIHQRRGDIGDARNWYQDLFTFTNLVREEHPDAKIVWFGESMGALIAAHAWREAPDGKPPCDALVLSSPIVRFRDDIPAWTPGLVQTAATAMPLARISLEALSGGQDVKMTQKSVHGEQVKKNPYHVERHTLRLIGSLSSLINGMNDCAATVRVPILILHGEHDFFNDDKDIRGFAARVPETTPVTYKNYPGAYHLLMYDEKRELVFRDVGRWVKRLRNGRLVN